MLKITDLKTYFYQDDREIKAVDGINLDVGKGELVALVGESGSGKSVTALSVTRLIPESGRIVSGNIDFEGANLLTLSEKQLRAIRGAGISYVFQEPTTSLNPVFTVGYQIAESVILHKKVSKKEAFRIAEDLLEKVGIDSPQHRLSSYPHQLSGGMRQRAMIAMALVSDPKLLIADEPTTALDVTIQAQILALLKKLQEELGLSILLITHDLSIVKSLADRIYIMQKGKVVEQGAPAEIFDKPKEAYTKKLIESIPKPSGETSSASEEAILLEAKGLKKYFAIEKGAMRKKAGEVKAVDDVSFTVKKGQTLGIVGESGSGKTTLAKLVLGLIKPDAGQLIYKGASKQVIFQDPVASLNPRMRVKDIIAEPLRVSSLPTMSHLRGGTLSHRVGGTWFKDKVLELLSHVGLPADYANRLPRQLSGGERQRVAIARALATGPQLIICDEPVSALDLTIQAQILKLLKDIQQRLGITYLFISHDLRVIEQVSDEVLVMLNGRIVKKRP